MADYSKTVTLQTDADTAYRWLSDVRNLPKYFPSMTSAEPTGEGEEVHVTAEVPDHGTEEGAAWFRTDDSARRLEWGSEDDAKDYHGWLKVSEIEGGSAVTLGMHLHHEDVDDGIGATLENVRRQLDGD